MTKTVDASLVYLRKYLPKQGPLEFFVHHNTFHEFENLPFAEALQKGQGLFAGRVLKSKSEYRSDLTKGKFDHKTLRSVLRDFLQENELLSPTNLGFAVNLLMERDSDLAKNRGLSKELEALNSIVEKKNYFFKTILFEKYHLDIDEIISPTLYKFFSAYFDQGSSYWKMPEKEDGLLESFRYYLGTSNILSSKWEGGLSKRIAAGVGKSANATIVACLSELSLPEDLWQNYLFDLALRYKGWGGLILSFEKHPEWNKRKEIVPSFQGFMAILLLCEVSYLKSLSVTKQKVFNASVPLVKARPLYEKSSLRLASRISKQQAYKGENQQDLLKVTTLLTSFNQRFLYHQAYEEHFYANFLNAFAKSQYKKKKTEVSPTLQVLCCIDDREESFRRYLEEVGPEIETIGVAGHFGLDIKYKGIFSAHHRALCPDSVVPTKEISEEVIEGSEVQKIFGLWAYVLWMQTTGSKTLLRGILFQFLTGIVAIFSLSITIISPYLASKLRHRMKARLNKRLKIRLLYDDRNEKGISLEEMKNYALGLLKTVGLKSDFAPVVAILGHGSHSLNNPHEAAHDCGACGGGRGAPNARLIAEILNRKDIRLELQKEQIIIPDKTVFLGGYHNTCSGEVSFFDKPKREDVLSSVKLIKRAARKDSVEKCRKFEDVSLETDLEKAYKHCFGRANNYMQPRPEYGHATNALCFVGPRWMCRDLFLDRRAFLTSYEPDQDNDAADILKGILSAVGPVCSGINLEYYFSYMDNEVYGCGTKLPHNVTALVGVMNGYQSDLLMGLPWQMVEIHDPYRLMLLVACKKEKVEKIIKDLESFNLLVTNQWIQLSVIDPETQILYRYRDGELIQMEPEDVPVLIYKNQKEAFSKQRDACQLGIVRA